MICWEELLTHLQTSVYQVPKDSIVQVWINETSLKPIVESGYRAVLSAGLYLSKQKPVWSSASHSMWEDTWEDMYSYVNPV
jgi:hypothetical protein